MMTAIALLLAPIQIATPTPAAAVPVEAVVGQRNWIGTLTVPSGVTLRIAVHIAAGADGALIGTLALMAAGGLKSDAGDMLDFLAANMGAQAPAPKPAPALATAMARMQVVRRAGEGPRSDMGIGWMIVRMPGGRIVMHDGATGGYTSTMAFDPVRRRGVVVLTNSAVQPGATDIGLHILTGSPLSPATAPPAPPASSKRAGITVPSAELDRFVGRYRYGPTGVMTITRPGTRPGDRLIAQLTGQMALPVYASGPLDFFWKAADARMTFVVADGRVVALTLHQDGKDITMPRIAD